MTPTAYVTTTSPVTGLATHRVFRYYGWASLGTAGDGDVHTIDLIFNTLCEVYTLFETDPAPPFVTDDYRPTGPTLWGRYGGGGGGGAVKLATQRTELPLLLPKLSSSTTS
jgi:hypothetical protein